MWCGVTYGWCGLGEAMGMVMNVCERGSWFWMVTSMTVSLSLSMELEGVWIRVISIQMQLLLGKTFCME